MFTVSHRFHEICHPLEYTMIEFLYTYRQVVFQTTVGRNPAPPVTYGTLRNMGYSSYQLVQDFFHQQYVIGIHSGFRLPTWTPCCPRPGCLGSRQGETERLVFCLKKKRSVTFQENIPLVKPVCVRLCYYMN